ncbi:MAG TPA: NAD-dependent epimerase/dehydratase family protein [Verrucomicrobiae bacterium]|nr:NAD-dependent epimerase/dehydratase family protein [Verrucomicrobiae bacterium]
MEKKALITGGAGFIGSHLVDELLAHGYSVRVFDNLDPQVHGPRCQRPSYLDPDVELIRGDVRDPEKLRRALSGIDVVVHFAALVGVGQSMYQVADYVHVNNGGTANLLQILIENPVERLVVASSMSLYGEGLYRAADGTLVSGGERSLAQLQSHDWELRGVKGEILVPIPTPETKPPALASAYALSKFDQEQLCLLLGRAYRIPTVALRFFNVYGPRQALSNPYTGVLAIFASRLLNNNPPLIFEDGLQRRDFVSVHDIARAGRLALETPEAAGQVFNIGSGRNFTIRQIAEHMCRVMDKEEIEPEITGKYRVGDIRHCFADISQARKVLGYEPLVSFDEGLMELAAWLEGQVAEDRFDQARSELTTRGLTA